MIAKNIKGKSFKGCVSYVMHEGAALLEAEGIWAETKEDIIRSFAMQRSGRKEIKQPVGHIPIAFSPEDKHRVTDDFMLQLAKEYMQEMGIGNTQYIIVRHHNTENPHLHIVYNRIDNNLKLISVNYDYKRNIKVCKKLKDKHGLTYGKDKEKVKREKLNNPDKIKYLIYDTIKAILPHCKTEKELQSLLLKSEINTEFKLQRTTGKVEGISFSYGNIPFKGSEVDRKFSFGNLKKEFDKNIEEVKRQEREEFLQEQTRIKKKQEVKSEADKQIETKQHTTPPLKHRLAILGVKITSEQEDILKNGGSVFLENMSQRDGNGHFSSYVFLNDEKDRVFLSSQVPETFVKYGEYEMRLRDKILIEQGYITKAKVKWWGGGSYAYPYLWKEDKSDKEYRQSWSDPRLPEPEKEKQKPQQTTVQQKNRGRKM